MSAAHGAALGSEPGAISREAGLLAEALKLHRLPPVLAGGFWRLPDQADLEKIQLR